MNLTSEQDLLYGARAYDPPALTAIYRRYSPGIYRYAMRHLGDDGLAEECVAETFSRFLKAIHAAQGPKDHLQAYLYRIAHNWVTDYYRRHSSISVELNDDLIAEDHCLPEAQVSIEMERQQVRQALQRLPSDQRQVIALRFIEGWESDEVAAALAKPAGTIRVLQFRALQTLRKLLLGEEEGV